MTRYRLYSTQVAEMEFIPLRHINRKSRGRDSFPNENGHVIRSWVWKIGLGDRDGLEISGCYNCLFKG